MKKGIETVDVGPERAGDVVAVLRASYRATSPDFPELQSFDGDVRYVGGNLMNRMKVKTAQAEERLVGVIAYSDDEVDKLYILPEWQGQRIGTQLMARAMAGADRLRLATFQVNTRARAFYADLGFSEIACSDGDNEEGQPDVQLEWRRE